MGNLAVGIELLFTGFSVVFLVLLFLMYIMKAISWWFGEKPVSKGSHTPMMAKPETRELPVEELVAVMAAVGKALPPNHQGVIRIKVPQVSGREEDEMAVAVIAGALAAAGQMG